MSATLGYSQKPQFSKAHSALLIIQGVAERLSENRDPCGTGYADLIDQLPFDEKTAVQLLRDNFIATSDFTDCLSYSETMRQLGLVFGIDTWSPVEAELRKECCDDLLLPRLINSCGLSYLIDFFEKAEVEAEKQSGLYMIGNIHYTSSQLERANLTLRFLERSIEQMTSVASGYIPYHADMITSAKPERILEICNALDGDQILAPERYENFITSVQIGEDVNKSVQSIFTLLSSIDDKAEQSFWRGHLGKIINTIGRHFWFTTNAEWEDLENAFQLFDATEDNSGAQPT